MSESEEKANRYRLPGTQTETQRTEVIAQVAGVDFSVALDIAYLRHLEKRIINAAKKNPHIRDFEVYNAELENQLGRLEYPERSDKNES